VRLSPSDSISCPHCSGGFLEEMSAPPPVSRPSGEVLRRRRLPTAELRRHRRASASSSDRYPFNPVIVLRRTRPDNTGTNSFELYYDDGAGSGLRPLPDSMSDFLMGSGFERLLDQLAQIEANGLGRVYENPPASKSSIESMPTLSISSQHVVSDSHCAVCKDRFELGMEVREMPCKHIYHQDCILPWLSIRNSCPVCRHEMPTDATRRGITGESNSEEAGNEDEMVGLTIWRLPGGGFAVGQFSGARRGTGSERELPVVYTEVDGGFNNGGAPRRVSWASRGSRSRERSGFGHFFQRIFGCFSPNSSSSDADASPSSPSAPSSSRNRRSSVLSRSSRSMRWEMENRDVDSIAR
jgi:E3 ubiquitin-protein ligase RNF115/126